VKAGLSITERFRYQWIFYIAVAWTILDGASWTYYMFLQKQAGTELVFLRFTWQALVLRMAIVLLCSIPVGYFLLFTLKEKLRRLPFIANILLKLFLLIVAFTAINIILHYTYTLFILHRGNDFFYRAYFLKTFGWAWIIRHCIGWLVTFMFTLLVIEAYEKYSPGVFISILLGRYFNPKEEERIVMFLDLKDSTPIAEQLGNRDYFKFLRDFIYYVSSAMLEYNGRIYQYVGDEVVVSWAYSRKNVIFCLKAIVAARKMLHYHSEDFRRYYKVNPEFKAGVHVGMVTIGDVGAVKRELAMSGDTMNTAARIRTACNEYNQKFIVSKEFLELIDVKDWQAESLGKVELKGKKESLELFALKI
jgi:adenylate cyclase